jgi:hypothetical protein
LMLVALLVLHAPKLSMAASLDRAGRMLERW